MTGEMVASEVTAENFPMHFAIAEAVNGTVKPFDQYQGPYVVVGGDVRIGSEPYAYCPLHLGVCRLWVINDDGHCRVYNENNDKCSDVFIWDDLTAAQDAALSVL